MSQDLLDPTVNQNSPQFSNGNLPNSTAVLVLGIISIVGCIFYGIPGLVCGIIAMVLHKKDKQIYLTNPPLYEASYKNSKAGYVCGIIGLSLSILFIVFLIFYVIFIFTAVSMFR
jgi:uncharacterized membrane protein